MRSFHTIFMLLLVAAEWTFAQDIVPVRTGNGPTPPPGGRRRKDPTADLPDLSRDELLAILDLIEKSGDSSGKSPVPSIGSRSSNPDSVPPRYPSVSEPSVPLYPELPEPSVPEIPPAPRPVPTTAPTFRPTTDYYYTEPPAPQPTPPAVPHYPPPMQPTPPNYPAPIAPTYPPSTTPKPKKSFLEKLVRGFIKIIAPQPAIGSRSSLPGHSAPTTFLEGFLQQLQQTQQTAQQDGQRRSFAESTQAAVLDNLIRRLQSQNSEGSQFVVNLVQTLKSSNPNAPGSAASAPVHPRSGGVAEQLLGALVRSVSSSGGHGSQGGQGQTTDSFRETLQRELLRTYSPSGAPTGRDRSAGDVLLDTFKQILQKNNH